MFKHSDVLIPAYKPAFKAPLSSVILSEHKIVIENNDDKDEHGRFEDTIQISSIPINFQLEINKVMTNAEGTIDELTLVAGKANFKKDGSAEILEYRYIVSSGFMVVPDVITPTVYYNSYINRVAKSSRVRNMTFVGGNISLYYADIKDIVGPKETDFRSELIELYAYGY